MGRWLSTHGRWGSPVLIAGESYGGYRVGRLVRMLQETAGIGLSGAILISPALEFGSLSPTDYDVLNWVDLLPTMAITAVHHGRSRAFAAGRRPSRSSRRRSISPPATTPPSSPAVRRCRAAERERILGRLADLIGLPADMVGRAEGRVTMHVHARAASRRAQGARHVRRDDHHHRSVPRSGGVRRP